MRYMSQLRQAGEKMPDLIPGIMDSIAPVKILFYIATHSLSVKKNGVTYSSEIKSQPFLVTLKGYLSILFAMLQSVVNTF